MFNPFDIFTPLLIDPLTNLLILFYHLASGLGLSGQLGWSIIFLTILVRLVLLPFYSAQVRHQKKMNELKPHLDELKTKYGHDRRRHQEEQMKLYKERGFNPAGGCLPALVQILLLPGFYYALFPIFNIFKAYGVESAMSHLNDVAYKWFPGLRLDNFSLSFYGLNLDQAPNHGLLLAVPLFTALMQLVLAKMTQIPSTGEKKGGEGFADAMASTQSTMLYIFPLMIGYFTFVLPLGLALYWNTTTIFAIIQQYLIAGPGGLVAWLPKKPAQSKK